MTDYNIFHFCNYFSARISGWRGPRQWGFRVLLIDKPKVLRDKASDKMIIQENVFWSWALIKEAKIRFIRERIGTLFICTYQLRKLREAGQSHIYSEVKLVIHATSDCWCYQHNGLKVFNVMAKILDCSFKVNEFELQSQYYVHFWTNTPWKRNESPYNP